MFEDMKNIWNNLSNQWKATLRTFAQSIIAAFTITVLGLLNVVLNWLNGSEVNWYEDISNVARIGAIALISSMTAVVTWIWNRVSTPPIYDGD